jgi:hypothetical protein
VSLRIGILIVKFYLATRGVQIFSGSGLPMPGTRPHACA